MIETKMFGRLTAMPEIKSVGAGSSVCHFSIACNDNYKDKNGKWVDRSYFFDCKAWGKMAEKIVDKFHKGQMVYIDCKPTQERWEQDGTKRSRTVFEVRYVEDLERYGQKANAVKPDQNAYKKPPAANVPDSFDDYEDDIPF